MALTPEQVKKLDIYQQKFLDGKITAQEYEFAKAEILWWQDTIWAEPTGKIHKIKTSSSPEKNNNEDESMTGDSIYAILATILKTIWVVFEKVFLAIYFWIQSIHHHILWVSKSRKVSLWKVYWSVWVIIAVIWIILIGIRGYLNYQLTLEQRIQDEKKANEQRLEDEKRSAEQKVRDEQNRAIAEEKAKTPQPSITILSSTGSQWKKTEYVLRFSSTGADTVSVNSERIEQNSSWVYEKNISLWLGETPITIIAKNKYFSDDVSFLVSREKTDAEVREDKEAEEKALAEEREAERLADEGRKQFAEQLAQELENEKKTYKTLSYALLSKNPDKYAGERIKFKGQIFNADEEGNISAFQINTDGYGYSDQIFTIADWSNDYVEWNWVTIWGVVVWEYCYQSQAGWDICVPSVKANIIE